jgi:hypothetical protein
LHALRKQQLVESLRRGLYSRSRRSLSSPATLIRLEKISKSNLDPSATVNPWRLNTEETLTLPIRYLGRKSRPQSSYKGASWILSRSEEITSEVRKLVLTCRSLEAQLQQSIPKKTHLEIVGKMQGAIDSISAELGRTKESLAKTTSLGERMNALESTLAVQNNMISSQNNVIGALTSKFSEALVLASTYADATHKIQLLEERIGTMVDRSQYDSLVDSYHEMEERLANTVPKDQYYVLEDKLSNSVSKFAYEELQNRISQMVPREDLASAESKVADLEHALLNSVPRQDFEELASKMAKVSSEAEAARTSAQATIEETRAAPIILEDSPAPPIQEFAPVAPVSPENFTTESAASDFETQKPVTLSESYSEPENLAQANEPPTNISFAPESTTTVPIPVSDPIVVEPSSVPIQEIVISVDNSQTITTNDQTTAEPEESQPIIVESIHAEQLTFESTPQAEESQSESFFAANSGAQTSMTESVSEVETVAKEAVVEEITTVPESVAAPEIESRSFDTVEVVSQPDIPQKVDSAEIVQETTVSEFQAPESATSEPAVETTPQEHSEIREVQSNLSEINAAAETGVTAFETATSPLVVEFERGFKFTSTEFCARSGLEFVEDLEKVDATVVEQHFKNGDFERWFKDVLADDSIVESIKSIRESSNLTGDEIRAQMVAVIAPHYRK